MIVYHTQKIINANELSARVAVPVNNGRVAWVQVDETADAISTAVFTAKARINVEDGKWATFTETWTRTAEGLMGPIPVYGLGEFCVEVTTVEGSEKWVTVTIWISD